MNPDPPGCAVVAGAVPDPNQGLLPFSQSQNRYFTPNWISLGLTDVLVIFPKVASDTFASGFANCGWFNILKNSARNSSLDSAIFILLFKLRSQLACPGPRIMPTPEFPYPVPSPIVGGKQRAVALKYPSSLCLVLPEAVRSEMPIPGQSCALEFEAVP